MKENTMKAMRLFNSGFHNNEPFLACENITAEY